MGNIQEQFHANLNGVFILPPGEYEGPLVVDRPCIVDGCKSTLWAPRGPVLTVSAPNVTVKNLRIEVTGISVGTEASSAIKVYSPDTRLENIEVNGNVIGLKQEPETWNLPGIISLGEFAANKENIFFVSLPAPCKAELDSEVKGLRIFPMQLNAGQNRLIFTTDELRDNTILYGEILVRTSVSRRIYVAGKALKDAPMHREAGPAVNGPIVSPPVQMDLPEEIVAPQVPDPAVHTLKKGQRIFAKELNSSRIRITYEHQNAAQGIEIDSYCFILGENGKVFCDEDLIFFGNTEAGDHSVKSGTSDGRSWVLVDINKVDASVSKIAVCYSVYGDDAGQNFSMVSVPIVRIFGGSREVFRFGLNDLSEEKTVVAMEIYRYRGEWKMNFVGAGYRNGLKQLCEDYGVSVE